jgi:streptomycin 6-kinase
MAGGAGGERFAIPAGLAATVVRWEGDGGRAWLARLPRLVAELAEAWDLEVGAPFDPGGQISWVAPALQRSDGRAVVLKVQHPHPESVPEAAALQAWGGRGAVELLAADPERSGLLLERCRPGEGLDHAGGGPGAVRAGAEIAAQLHEAPAPATIPALTDALARWADELEVRLAAVPWPDVALGRLAVAAMRDRSQASADGVLLHGDLNPTNVLSAERAPWLAIDPKPMVGEPAFDGARLVLQPDPFDADALEARLVLVAEVMGVERAALVAWCLIDAVRIGSWARLHGETEIADRCVRHAHLLAPLQP